MNIALLINCESARAFRGEIVPQDPNDECASTLLERIRIERVTRDGAKLRKSPKQ